MRGLESPVILRRIDSHERQIGEIAELAVACGDHATFRDSLLDRLDRLIGFDLASMHSARDPGVVSMHVRGYDANVVEQRIHGYMMEFEPHEIAAVDATPMVDTEVIPLRRREQLSLYREQLWPQGVSVFTTAIWRNRHGGFGFHLARTGRGRTFRRREIETLELALPAIKLAESYLCVLATPTAPAVTRSFEVWADQVGLTRAERRVAELGARGLQNREIAAVLGISSLTVRNQLSGVFRKADVSNRAELAFVCSSSEAGSRDHHAEPIPWSTFFQAGARG